MKHLREMISENTSISIGLVIALISGLFWLTAAVIKSEATANTVSEIKENQKEYNQHLQEINQRLSRIEGMLEAGN